MLSIRTLSIGTLTLALAAAFAPAALAQDASGGTASGKRFTVTGGYSLTDPTRIERARATTPDMLRESMDKLAMLAQSPE